MGPVGASAPLAVRMRPGIARRSGRAGSPAAAGLAAAPAGRGLGCGVGHPLRAARHRQDHAGVADLAGDRPPVRGAVGAVGRGEGSPRGDRRRAPGRRARRADRAVHRRGAPVLQDPAGRAAVGRREPGGAAGGGHHGEPVVLGRRAAAVAVADPAAAAARPPTTCAPWSSAPSTTRAAWAGRSRSTPTRSTCWCSWPPVTPGAR